eukprot:TRINITY_DN1675_c0_g1_i5.p2 TRINITY_DN1675_c0_g1~~TRINITY_DN1675_c0_g1_i5.p2  ORF type:complete len:226 (-),score=5.40 TRINITY_DN1675_c0_g1_i5:145-822(-)
MRMKDGGQEYPLSKYCWEYRNFQTRLIHKVQHRVRHLSPLRRINRNITEKLKFKLQSIHRPIHEQTNKVSTMSIYVGTFDNLYRSVRLQQQQQQENQYFVKQQYLVILSQRVKCRKISTLLSSNIQLFYLKGQSVGKLVLCQVVIFSYFILKGKLQENQYFVKQQYLGVILYQRVKCSKKSQTMGTGKQCVLLFVSDGLKVINSIILIAQYAMKIVLAAWFGLLN